MLGRTTLNIGESRRDRIAPAILAFLERLGSHARLALAPAFRSWQESGGNLKTAPRGVALQALWDDRPLTLMWLYGPNSTHPEPRLEIPLSTLARRLPDDLLDEYRDDLSTVRGMDLNAVGRFATITIDDAFTDADASRIVTIALELARRL